MPWELEAVLPFFLVPKIFHSCGLCDSFIFFSEKKIKPIVTDLILCLLNLHFEALALMQLHLKIRTEGEN